MKTKPFSFKSLIFPLTIMKAVHIIIILGFLVYSNSFFNTFILDDYGLILRNPSIHSVSTIPNLFLNKTGSQLTTDYYRPLPATIYTFIYALFQDNPFFYHFVQLLFHITNSVFIFLLLKTFLKKGLSFFLSVLFLIHPLNSETVVYMSALQDVIFVTFGLLSLLLIQRNSNDFKYVVSAYFALFLCLLSKETGFLFVIINWIYLIIQKRKIGRIHIIFTASIGIFYAIMRSLAHISFNKDALVPIMSMSLQERMINIPAIIFYYLRNLFYPKDIVALNSWVITKIQFSSFYLPLLLDMLFFAGTLLLLYKVRIRDNERKTALFFLFWFLIGIGFHIQIIPLDLTVSDRYFYFPMIGLFGFIGIYIQKMKVSRLNILTISLLGLLLLVIFSLKTIDRNADWRNLSALLEHDHNVLKNDYLLEFLYGYNLFEQGKYDDAFVYVRHALSLYPQSYKGWNVLGAIYYQKGDIQQAKKAFSKSLEINPNYAVQENIALLLLKHDDILVARNFIRKSTNLYPNSEKLWFYRLVVENKTGDYNNALTAAKQYYILKQDKESYDLYIRILKKEKVNIEIK